MRINSFGCTFVYNFLLPFVSGFLLTYSLPPFFQQSCIASFSVLLALLDTSSHFPVNLQDKQDGSFIYKSNGVAIGFSFGFGHFLSGIYWLIYPLQIANVNSFFLIPLVLFLPSFLLSLFIALLCYLITGLLQCARMYFVDICDIFPNSSGRNTRLFIAISFAILWMMFEVIRSYAFCPFPWNLTGYAIMSNMAISQVSSIIGVHGATALIVLLGSLIYVRRLDFTIFTFFVILLLHSYGETRMNSRNINQADSSKIVIYGIQENAQMSNRWDHNIYRMIEDFRNILKITKNGIQSDISQSNNNLVIWSEGGYPFHIKESINVIENLKGIVPKSSKLISGTGVHNDQGIYNGFILTKHDGLIEAKYYKRILAPFGEYIPSFFSIFSSFIPQAITGVNGFLHAPYSSLERVNIILSYEKDIFVIAPYICFEILVSPFIFTNITDDTDFIVNTSNDGWFKSSIGVYQHMNMARMKAIEYGLPLVRVVTTGVSAVIDQYGLIQDYIDVDKADVMKATIHKGQKIQTLYRKINILEIMVLLSLCPFLGIFSLKYVCNRFQRFTPH